MLLGVGMVIIWYCFSSTTFNTNVNHSQWQVAYYFFSIIGSVGTCLAVIVALAKESILKWLYNPDITVSLVDNGVSEIIPNENQKIPVASAFECQLLVENTGSIGAIGCKVFISELKHGKSKDKVL